jgi:hypothetical protein
VAKTPRSRSIKLLFIGNSFTQRNNLPELLAELAAAHNLTIAHDLKSVGGASLRTHWNAGRAAKAIATGGFDYVVLQEQSTLPVKSELAISGRKLADVHHRPRQEEPLALTHVRSSFAAVATMPNTLPFLFALDDGRLECLHRAANRGRTPAERKRRHKPVPLVVSAQVTTTDRQPPTRHVEHQVPQPRLYIKDFGLDRVAERILQLIDLTVAFATHVNLKSVARRADAQVGADGVEALF